MDGLLIVEMLIDLVTNVRLSGMIHEQLRKHCSLAVSSFEVVEVTSMQYPQERLMDKSALNASETETWTLVADL